MASRVLALADERRIGGAFHARLLAFSTVPFPSISG